MSEQPSASPPARAHHPWVWPATLLLLAAILVGGGLWLAGRLLETPARTLDKAADVVHAVGLEAREVARALRSGTLRQEFLSRAVEMNGMTKLQVATLKQHEIFRNEESGALWETIPLPKVVVQADAPVEYSYTLDLAGSWEFRQQDRVLTVIPPPLEPNTPALDVSALKFYTLEGALWPHESKVRERLRERVTSSLSKRARNNLGLVREVARRQVADFVEKWLSEKFGDGRDYQVKVIFPDELPLTPEEKSRL